MIFEELLQTQVISVFKFVIVITIGVIITKLVTDLMSDFLKRRDIKRLIARMGYSEIIIDFIIIIIKYVFYSVTFIIALSQFGFAKLVFDIILILIALFLIVLLIFSLKDFIPNAAAGVYLNAFKSIKKGDVLKIGNYVGKVTDIDIVSITLEDEIGRLTIIPNSNVIKKEIIKLPTKKFGRKTKK